MDILVTGGCGFIGSHYVELVLKNHPGDRVINVDALTYAAHPDTAQYLQKLSPDRYRFVAGDIASPKLVETLRNEKFDAIVNFAAESHVDRSILDPESFVRTNVLGAQKLLHLARERKVRMVHVSTDEVYGSLAPTDPTSTEESKLDPNSPYAASKASADLVALANARTFKQDVLITRCTNNYGPFQFPEKLLPLLIANAVENQPVPVYGDGMQVRDWIYVGDHCEAIDLVLRKGRSGEIYNVSASEERHNIDLVKKVLKRLDRPESLITFVGDRPAHDRRYGLDATKIRKELGWKPSHTFEAGLEKTVKWYLAQEDWWKKVRNKDYFKYYQDNYHSKFEEKNEVSA